MKILFTKQPGDKRYKKDTYTTINDKKAQEFIDAGVAVPFDEFEKIESTDEGE